MGLCAHEQHTLENTKDLFALPTILVEKEFVGGVWTLPDMLSWVESKPGMLDVLSQLFFSYFDGLINY